ncbi:MAG: sigma-54 dependent transcriptional regulator [Dysgonamonadaceae bacterium]|jgi:DNA-binding NtrC family response regulator|nr:sigma-54 dependent transcriptional regulator [Dysgonamonadaceae bacterium]
MKLLIVDDEENIRLILESVFSEAGYQVETAINGLQAMEKIKDFYPEIILLDKNMPYMNGLDILQRIKKHYPNIVVVMVTAYGDVASAVEAMKMGAYDYIEKPFDNDKMLLLLKRAGEYFRLQTEVLNLRSAVNKQFSFEHIVGNSPALNKVLKRVSNVCETDASVLIMGESGTGKELVAKAIHFNSPRKDKPLITVNCGAIPLQLAESELFGHEKGAFTDAKELKIGKFEQAQGGTLFLDEIGELPLDAQVKLLRVLEDKKISRIGGKKEIEVDIRLISATNNNLFERVQNNTFRLDLFYRINIFVIQLPPLREHSEDITLLTDHFIRKHNKLLRTKVTGCSRETLSILQTYTWPGNIRDLENAIQSALIVCKTGKILPEHLPARLDFQKEKTENEVILKALEQCKFNKTETASYLGVSRKTLFNKMKKYGLLE